jgi:hypothetical protein
LDVVEDPPREVAYSVPQSYTFQFDERFGQVTLTAPRGSATFRVQKVEQREGGTVYRLGERISDGKNGPYLEPRADQEIERLVNEIVAAGGDVTQASAWAEGEGRRLLHAHAKAASRSTKPARFTAPYMWMRWTCHVGVRCGSDASLP